MSAENFGPQEIAAINCEMNAEKQGKFTEYSPG